MSKTNDFQWNFENTLLTLGQDEIFSNAECKVSYNCKYMSGLFHQTVVFYFPRKVTICIWLKGCLPNWEVSLQALS